MKFQINRRGLLKTAAAGAAFGALQPFSRAFAATDLVWMTWENLAKDDYLAAFEGDGRLYHQELHRHR